ncbi:MAG: ATP-grasp domain-containing protein, partial [Planctomycetota bacterium]
AGVPLIPGTLEPVTQDELFQAAREAGFPIMLKAQGGGGGKGIRIVHSEEELESAFRRASSEAKTAFGLEALYLEKVILKPRHVEVQILGDGRGKVIALGERDCSLQRRHQKIVEETPCHFISPQTRKALHEGAVKIGQHVSYRGAGTVEFLVDSQENFYFLEMNTRLQVEHPVTEEVYDIDLVEAQIQIAQGGWPDWPDLEPRGHALEIRVVAEDPYANFLPSTGEISYLHLPGGPGVRLDSGLYEGQRITPYYDPLLAKLILVGKNRQEVLKKALTALSEFHIKGVSTNLGYVASLLEDERIHKGDFHTRFLEEDFIPHPPMENREMAALAAALFIYLSEEAQPLSQDGKGKMNYWKYYGRTRQLR